MSNPDPPTYVEFARRRRRRTLALVGFGLLSPALVIGAYALLLFAAQDHPGPEPHYVDGVELRGLRWLSAPPRTLEVDLRFFRRDGRPGVVFPQRVQLVELEGMRYPLDGENATRWELRSADATAVVRYTLGPRARHGRVVKVVAYNREPVPPDPFGWLRWLPGMSSPPQGQSHEWAAIPRLLLPPEPGAKPISPG